MTVASNNDWCICHIVCFHKRASVGSYNKPPLLVIPYNHLPSGYGQLSSECDLVKPR